MHLHHLLPPDRFVQLDHDPYRQQDAGAGRVAHRPYHVGARGEGAHGGSGYHRHDRDVPVQHATEDARVATEPGDLHSARFDLPGDVLGAHVRRHDPELREHHATADEDGEEDDDVE